MTYLSDQFGTQSLLVGYHGAGINSRGGQQAELKSVRGCHHLAHKLVVGEDRSAAQRPVVLDTVATKLQLCREHNENSGNTPNARTDPVGESKVDGLCKVESLVEASVVGARKGHHKLARTLVCTHHLRGTLTPSHPHTLTPLTGMPCFMRMVGLRMVTRWCSRSGWFWKSSGACSFIVASNSSAYADGTPYHVLGSPLQSVADNNKDRHAYKLGARKCCQILAKNPGL